MLPIRLGGSLMTLSIKEYDKVVRRFVDDYADTVCNSDLDTFFIASESVRKELVEDHLGVWEADNEDDLIEEITAAAGWCIKSIDYDIQLK